MRKTPTNEMETAAWKLWYHYYTVRIPERCFYAPETIEFGGFSKSGDYDADTVSLDSSRLLKLPIVGIADHYALGNEVKIDKMIDAANMYSYILEHLEDWRDIMRDQYIAKCPPINDLMELDDLARHLHEHEPQFRAIEKARINQVKSIHASQWGWSSNALSIKKNSVIQANRQDEGYVNRTPYVSALDEIMQILNKAKSLN